MMPRHNEPAHWLCKAAELFKSETMDLYSLAIEAGGDPKTFYIGVDLSGVDLRGQDLRGMKFTTLSSAIDLRWDNRTRLDPEYCEQLQVDSTQSSAPSSLRKGSVPGNDANPSLPRLVAEFKRANARRSKSGSYNILFGISGCPAHTRQVLFFTDDGGFTKIAENSDIAVQLCFVLKSVQDDAWVHRKYNSEVYRDCRLYAVGILADKSHFVVSTTICDALENYAWTNIPDWEKRDVMDAIAELRSSDHKSVYQSFVFRDTLTAGEDHSDNDAAVELRPQEAAKYIESLLGTLRPIARKAEFPLLHDLIAASEEQAKLHT